MSWDTFQDRLRPSDCHRGEDPHRDLRLAVLVMKRTRFALPDPSPDHRQWQDDILIECHQVMARPVEYWRRMISLAARDELPPSLSG